MSGSVINTSNINNDNGRISFSGASSGIDWQASVDAIIAAKRLPADQIEKRIKANESTIDGYDQLKALTLDLANKLELLKGKNQYASTTNSFDAKVAGAESSVKAGAPGGHVASAVGTLLGVAATSDAQKGSHTVEILQVAEAHQIRSGQFASKTDDFTTLGKTTGDITINGKTIQVNGSDNLLSLRDKINSLNSGSDALGVSASIVSVSDTEHYIVLSSDKTGASNAITFGGTQAVHNDLGFTTGGTDTVANEVKAAQNSQILVDGVATVVERDTNTINDVFEGVTLELLAAEVNTEIEITVDHNYQEVKDSIVNVVEAYNALRDFTTNQRTEQIRTEGSDKKEQGPLAFDPVMREVETQLGGIATFFGEHNVDGYQSLGQIGITMDRDFKLQLDDSEFDSKLLGDIEAMETLFSFQVSTSDARVVYYGHTEETTTTLDGTSLEQYYINIQGTDANGSVIGANISTTLGNGTAGDATISVDGNRITVTSGDAKGLSFLVFGTNLGPVADVGLTYSRGAADNLFEIYDKINSDEGSIKVSRDNLTSLNESHATDVETIDERLVRVRENLTQRFIAMETAMSRLNNLKEQLAQQLASISPKSDS